jgi:hypothetical protein
MATPKQLKGRRRFALVALVVVGMLIGASGFALADSSAVTGSTDTTATTTDTNATTTDSSSSTTTAVDPTTTTSSGESTSATTTTAASSTTTTTTATSSGSATLTATPYNASVGTVVQFAGTGMNAGEMVKVDVAYPDASLAQEHVVQADTGGNFSDSYTILSTDPSGIYTVTATGQSSANSASATFDPAVQANCLQFDNPGHFDPVTPTVALDSDGVGIDITWTDQCSNEENYIVQRSATGTDPWTDVATLAPNTTSYEDKTAVCGTAYYYRIEAIVSNPGQDNQTSFSNVSSTVTLTCHPTSVATTIYLKGTSSYTAISGTGPVSLASIVRDSATVSVTDSSGLTPTGKVTFTFYKNGTCDATNASDVVTTQSDVPLTSGSANSNDTNPLHAGSYSYKVHYTPDAAFSASDGPCEKVVVSQGTATVATEIRNASNTAVTTVVPGTTIHDYATVSGSSVTGFAPTGTVNFVLYSGSTCGVGGGSALKTDSNVALSSGSANSTGYAIPSSFVGSLSYKVHYNGDGTPNDYPAADASCEVLNVLPPSLVTDSSLCTFDEDTSAQGTQFRLIYTPDMTSSNPNTYYKLNASNPGQFYYNVFYVGDGSTTLNITIPAPFVTQGAVPVHVYTGVSTSSSNGQTCLTPQGDITSSAVIGGVPVTVKQTGSSTITVHLPSLVSSGKFAYIAIHLDYGDKGAAGCIKTGTNMLDAQCATPAVTIGNLTTYTFMSPGGNAAIQNENVFKHDPGIGGLVTQNENPIAGTTVQIYDGSNHLLGTVTTDSDGWYMWNYKYTGKAATFVVKLPTYGLSQTVTLKSNSFLLVNFTF